MKGVFGIAVHVCNDAQGFGGKMIERILVSTDFSEPSLAAVRYALDLADAVGGRIILLHVVEGEPVHSYMVGERPPLLKDELASDRDLPLCPLPQRIIRRDLCEEAYWKLAVLFPPGDQNRVCTVVTAGKPTNEIVRVAREQEADLIILGSRGWRGLRRLLRRTVTDKVMRKALVPVIAVNAHHRGLGGAAGGSGAPYQRVGGGHVDVHCDEMVRTVHRGSPWAMSANSDDKAGHVTVRSTMFS
jgi:nucleotide-binding universal stress UspA family protein